MKYNLQTNQVEIPIYELQNMEREKYLGWFSPSALPLLSWRHGLLLARGRHQQALPCSSGTGSLLNPTLQWKPGRGVKGRPSLLRNGFQYLLSMFQFQEFSVTLADVAPYKQHRRISSGHSSNTGDSELWVKKIFRKYFQDGRPQDVS